MANLPTGEEIARRFLAYFGSMEARPGHTLLGGNIVHFQTSNKLSQNELISGLEYAIDKGWIEQIPNNMMRLTEAGFKEI